ncbi:MAG: c-type cytochrome [Ginsengibacter sp.]
MNNSKSQLVFLKIIAVSIFLFAAYCSADAQSSKWSVPNSAVSVKNPVPNDAASVKNGKTIYLASCAPCHGDGGKGDGPASASLNPKPADHTSTAFQAQSDGAMFYEITAGHAHTAMPPFKAALTTDQRWAVINYIRTLGKK